jgi:membrane protein
MAAGMSFFGLLSLVPLTLLGISTLGYLLVPHVKVIARAALIGAVSAVILLQTSRFAFGFIMIRFDIYGRIYGPLAGVIVFMMWLYLSMIILLLGAELGSQCQKVLFSTDGNIVAEEHRTRAKG